MKIRILDVEVTPEELRDSPELRAALLAGNESHSRAVSQSATPPDPVEEFVAKRGKHNPAIDLIQNFVAECRSWPNVEAIPGKSKNSDDGFGPYLRLRHTAHRLGSFVYVTPSNGAAGLRLRREDAEGIDHATTSDTQDEYQVRVTITSSETLEVAVELAREAYKRTAP